MGKQPNYKLIVILSGLAAALAVGVHLVHRAQVVRSARILLSRASLAEKEGRPDQAQEYLSRYLIYRPDDVDALFRYGKSLEDQARSGEQLNQALRVYRKAVQIASDRNDIRRRLVDLAMRQSENNPQMFATAKTHIEVLLYSSPRNGELTYLLGRCEEGGGRFREAADLYDKARHGDPKLIEAYTRLADLLRVRLNDPTRADQVMEHGNGRDDLIAANADSAAAYLARARYRRKYALPNVDPAADIATALKLSPESPEVILAAAESALLRKDDKAARAFFGRGIELDPLNPAMYQGLADLELKAERAEHDTKLKAEHAEEALKTLRRGIKALGNGRVDRSAGLAWSLADTLIRVGKLDEAGAVMKDLKDRNIRPELLDYLNACQLVARKKWAEAARALKQIQPALGAATELRALTKRSLVLLGECYNGLGNIDQRYDAYRRAVTITLDDGQLWTSARMGLAAALTDLNRIDEALEQYRIALAKEPNAGLALTRLQIVRNRDRADAERNWQELERTLDSVEQQLVGTAGSDAAVAGVTVLRAEILAAQGQFLPARRLLEQAVSKYPDQVDVWVTLANLADREGKSDEMLDWLDKAQERLGDGVELRLARASYWVRHGGGQTSRELAKLEEGAESFAAEDRSRLRRELARALVQIGQDEQALRVWERLVKQQPDDLDGRIGLFNATLKAGNEVVANQALDQVRRLEGDDGTAWRYGKALLLVQRVRSNPADRKPLTEARRELLQVASKRPSWPIAALAMGEVEELDGHADAAIEHYLQAILVLGERDPNAVARTLQLLIREERLAEAAQVVKRLRDERVPLSGELQRMVAQFWLQSGETARALELAKRSVSELSTNPSDLIWLGQVEWAHGQDAEPAFRRAVALDGQSPDAWLALIEYLARTGKNAEAEAALQKAEQAASGKSAPLRLAQAYEAVGRPEKAEKFYRSLRHEKPVDLAAHRSAATHYLLREGRIADSAKHLHTIIDQGGSTTDKRWANEMLMTITALEGNPRQALKALETLGLAEQVEPGRGRDDANPADLRMRAKILAMQPSLVRRREAISILEKLRTRKVATANDLSLLAQLLDAQGDWQQARERMLELVNAGGNTPEFMAVYVRALLQHDRVDEAKVYLAKLERMAPGQPGTIEIKARVLVAEGKGKEADTLLTGFGRAEKSQLERVAVLLEQLGRPAAAESLFREFVANVGPGRPEATLALAGFLGREKRTKEALDVLDDQAWKTIPAGAVADASLTILFRGKPDPALFERVGRRLDQAIRAYPDQVSLQFSLANLRILEGRYADAEEIFRSVYERDKAKGSPLNNLAWMLALQGQKSAEALALVQQAIELEGETPDFLDTRALAYLEAAQPDAAVRDLEDAIAVAPSAEKYFHLARAYQMAGKRREASAALDKAKADRLTADDLHPLERDSYNALLGQLAKR